MTFKFKIRLKIPRSAYNVTFLLGWFKISSNFLMSIAYDCYMVNNNNH